MGEVGDGFPFFWWFRITGGHRAGRPTSADGVQRYERTGQRADALAVECRLLQLLQSHLTMAVSATLCFLPFTCSGLGEMTAFFVPGGVDIN